MDTEVISVRVKKGTKTALLKRKININEAVRVYLENLEREEAASETIQRLAKLIETKVKPSKLGFGAKSVRWDREHAH